MKRKILTKVHEKRTNASPSSIAMSKSKSYDTNFDEHSPMDVAAQLTLILAEDFYSKLTARDFVTIDTSPTQAYLAIQKHLKFVEYWAGIQFTLISKKDTNHVEESTKLIIRFIDIAHRCYEYRNYATMQAIISALNSVSIR